MVGCSLVKTNVNQLNKDGNFQVISYFKKKLNILVKKFIIEAPIIEAMDINTTPFGLIYKRKFYF